MHSSLSRLAAVLMFAALGLQLGVNPGHRNTEARGVALVQKQAHMGDPMRELVRNATTIACACPGVM